MRTLNLLPLFILLLGCTSVKVKHLGTDQIASNYYYVLPKTALVIDIPVTTTTYKRGARFYNNLSAAEKPLYQEKFGLDTMVYKQFISSNNDIVKYSIGDIKLSNIARPDFDKIYTVEASPKFLKNHSVSFLFNEDGILTESSMSSENVTFDLAIKGISGLASIVGSLAKGASVEPPANTHLDELNTLADSYIKLITGEARNQPNYDVYKDVKANLAAKLQSKFSLLFYSTQIKVDTLKLIYTPIASDKGHTINLFGLDQTNGTIEIDQSLNSKHEYIYKGKVNVGNSIAKPYKIKFASSTDQFHLKFNPDQVKKKGYAYNIPENVFVSLIDPDNKTLNIQKIKIPQFGIVTYFNAKQSKVSIKLNPQTGELVKVEGESKALSGDNVKNSAAATEDIINKIKGDSEATELENQYKILDYKKKIKELKDQGF